MVKALAVYDTPFWRRAGLAGSAMSHAGPFREFHDHSGAGGTPAAIFGFAPAGGLTGAAGRDLAVGDLADLVRQQLGRLFGAEGARPLQVLVRDWSRGPFTQPQTTPADDPRLLGGGTCERPLHGIRHWVPTETATSFSGHVGGAIRSGLWAAAVIGSRA